MKTHIEISRDNLVHNLSLFARITGRPLMFVVKANAYGHGLREVVKIASQTPFIGYYAVDSTEEAVLVRELDSSRNILLLGWTDRENLEPLIRHNIETVAPSIDFLNMLNREAKKTGLPARVHLKVETGTARLGMTPDKILALLKNNPYPFIRFTGIYSHFANIEDTTNHAYAAEQLKKFTDILEKTTFDTSRLVKHFSCSAATLLFPKTRFDIPRVGISAYGYWPSKHTYISYIEKNKEPLALKPVLSWHAKIAQVKTLNTGDHIGYGITYRTFNKTVIAVTPVGYYDGYDRKMSNMANVLVKGVKAPLRGRVCMDMFMAETTHIKHVKAGETVTLIGGTGSETISADDLAEWSGSINYEILARINPLIPRIIV